jgi:cytochrome c553
MRKLVCALLFAALTPAVAFALENSPWAYPVLAPGTPPPKRDPEKIITVPGSDKKYNEVEVNNPFGPPDWFPGDHAPMPKQVAAGARPDPRACSLCHLTTGDGHPESAGIAGLPAAYMLRQLQEFANGGRVGPRTGAMAQIAAGFKGDFTKDAKEAVEYFAARKPREGYVKVTEAAMVPKSFIGEGAMRFAVEGAGAGMEPIGVRVVTLPQDKHGAEARNPRTGFEHFVPPGAIKKGEELVKTGGNGKTVACAICHGEGLHGLGEVPTIANRDLLYTVRQLNDIQNGARSGNNAALMRQVVAKLTLDDMVSISAYLGTLKP